VATHWHSKQNHHLVEKELGRRALLSFHEVVSFLVGSLDAGHVELSLQGRRGEEKRKQ